MDCWCDCSYIPWDVQGLDQIYLIYTYKMGKLLKLLNEYLWQSGIVAIDQEIEWGRDIFFENVDWFHAEEAEIISKKFWFIERLVNKDRINYYKVGEIVDTYKWSLREKAYVVEDCTVESMLMILTIQDDPINFLISVLK